MTDPRSAGPKDPQRVVGGPQPDIGRGEDRGMDADRDENAGGELGVPGHGYHSCAHDGPDHELSVNHISVPGNRAAVNINKLNMLIRILHVMDNAL